MGVNYVNDEAHGCEVVSSSARRARNTATGALAVSGYTVYDMARHIGGLFKRDVELYAQGSSAFHKMDSVRLSIPKEAWVGAALTALLDSMGKRQLPACLGLHPLLDAMVAERLGRSR